MPKRRRTNPRPEIRQRPSTSLVAALARTNRNRDELTQRLRGLGKLASEDFARDFAALQARVRETDPLCLLGWFGFYQLLSLTHQLNQSTAPRVNGRAPLGPHHVELVQALALRCRADECGNLPMTPDRAGALAELVQSVFHTAGMCGFASIEPGMSLEERARMQIVNQMQLETQGTRGWGYPEQIAAIVGLLFAPLDDDIASSSGVRVSALLTMCERISLLIAGRCEEHIAALRPVVQAKTVEATIAAYYAAFPDQGGDPAELLALFTERGASREHARSWLVAHADLRLSDLFMLHRDDFAAAYPDPVDPAKLEAVLRRWSLEFGSLADKHPEHFGLDSPVSKAPLIALDEGWFFLPIPTLLGTSALELMEALVLPMPPLRRRYEERRGRFLEEEIARLFAAAFPAATILRGVMRDDPGTKQRFENDLVVSCDTWLISVEAKAGRIGPSTRRGGEKSLRRDVSDLLVAPSTQSGRLIDFLRAQSGLHHFTNKDGDEIILDTTGVRQYLQLSITLDSPGLLTAHTPTLRDASLVPGDTIPVPTMGLADLDTVLTLLRNPAERLHYLARRAQFERGMHYLADELDLLAFYLETGLTLDRARAAETGFALYGLSEQLHPYLMRQWTGIDAARPERKLAPLWRALIERIEERQRTGWLDQAMLLLDAPYDAQLAFERDFRRALRRIRKGRAEGGREEATMINYAGAHGREAVVGLAYRGYSFAERDQLLAARGEESLAMAKAERALLIGVDADHADEPGHDPYSVLAMVFRPTSPPQADDLDGRDR